jgi:hypothetical protein
MPGAFLNVEPVTRAAAGVVVFSNPGEDATRLRPIANFFLKPQAQQPQGLSASFQVNLVLPDLRPSPGLAYVGPL